MSLPTKPNEPVALLQHKVSCMLRLASLILLMGASLFLGCSSEGQNCQQGSDCPAGTYCRSNGTCQAGCQLSIECPTGQLCSANQCVTAQKDEDKDGFPFPLDCNDQDPLVVPGAREICGNNKDDNCNGQTDEEGCVQVECTPGQSRDCYEGKETTLTFPGTRCKKGKQICTSEGVWGDCQGQVLPAPEDCDGEDNDCNGKVDDGTDGQGLTRTCYSGPAQTRGLGTCKEGTQRCESAKWSECTGDVVPKAESCDGTDSDCDGQIDNAEGVGESCDTGQPGACSQGTRGCDAQQKKVVCLPDTSALDEVCGNNKDDNCDGNIDDGCPLIPTKITEVRSFPHYVALSAKYAAVSLKTTKKLAIFDRTKQPPVLLREATLSEAPYGVQIDGDIAYVVSDTSLYKVDLQDAKVETFVTFASGSHAGDLVVQSGRAFTRRAEANNTTLSFCLTDLTTKQTDCAALKDQVQHVGAGVAIVGAQGLVLSNRGVHVFEQPTLKEDTSLFVPLPGAGDHMAYDTKTKQLVVTSAAARKVYVIDLSLKGIVATLEVYGDQSLLRTPGHVATFEGKAFVGQRNDKALTLFDLGTRKLVQKLDICTAPEGITLAPADAQTPQKGGLLWVACAGENTLRFFRTGP